MPASVCVWSVDHIWSYLKIPYKLEDESGAAAGWSACVNGVHYPPFAITSFHTLDSIDSKSIELWDGTGLSDVWGDGRGGGDSPIFFLLLRLILGSFWMWIYLYARLSFHFTPIENWIVVFSAFSVAACPSDVLFILCVWKIFVYTHYFSSSSFFFVASRPLVLSSLFTASLRIYFFSFFLHT